jgi:hypothetical protein
MIYSYSMFQQPPQQQNLTNYFPNTDEIGTGITNTMNSVSSSIADTKNSFQNTMNEFSSANVINAGNEFLQSNSLIAKFGFIILVLFGFLFLFKIGMLIISSILSPSDSPYLIKGLISGTESIRVQQDSRTSSAVVNYSENQPTGLEFTYSVWILLNSTNTSDNSKYAHIFNKGIVDGSNITVSGVNNLSNAPGLYVKGNRDGTSTFRVYMDTFSQSGSIQNIDDQRTSIDINGIPYNKWVNVIIRAQNRILDVYVNGVLTQHKDLGYVPRQNFGDVYVCNNGGFSGKLSDLRYYAKALNVFEINGIVGWGPNLTTSPSASGQSNTDATYLSHLWYKATQ